MAEEDHAARSMPLFGRDRHALEPRPHGDDVRGREPLAHVTCVSRLERAFAELEASVGASAAEAVDGVEPTCDETGAEAIVRVVDAPVDDLVRSARNEPAGTGECVEAEPRIGARGANGHEQVEGIRQRRP